VKTLKSQNNKFIWLFILFNITIFAIFYFDKRLDYDQITEIWSSFTLKDGFLLAIAPLITLIVNGIIPSNVKAVIVFWRVHNALPGHRVFTKLLMKDSRIDQSSLENKYGKLPLKATDQNNLWYKIYKKNENDVIVIDSHKNFLLLRDLSSISFIILFLFPIIIIFNNSLSLLYPFLLFIQFITITISAKNYGNRFALNVLAIESTG